MLSTFILISDSFAQLAIKAGLKFLRDKMLKCFKYNLSFNTTTTLWNNNYSNLQMRNLNFSIISLYKPIREWRNQNSSPVLSCTVWFSSSTLLFFFLSPLWLFSKFKTMILYSHFLDMIPSFYFICFSHFSTLSFIQISSKSLVWCPI